MRPPKEYRDKRRNWEEPEFWHEDEWNKPDDDDEYWDEEDEEEWDDDEDD